MATKAELEEQLAELRQQLADRPEPKPEAETDPADDAAENKIDWEHEASELISQFDDLAHKKPLLFALGAFGIGFMLGRSK